MASLSEERIRDRAYHLWREAGEPAGRMDTFWYEAEKLLLAERAAQSEVPPGLNDNLPV
ncbi:hypothetical protein ABIF68_006634 [Bradyrhizobium japonicum]